ncbi:uncharacterized protein LOC110837595 [Zootermopsis nevadensis]|uniref:uncharacterized protein LOC110837595 n=1 Tax=Zootermopsis nevadensis TaxID=136037 RepID=UPI000B8E5628|nr:uncharacterized protein LOC110837595 [Zootermopsis nevadensis]
MKSVLQATDIYSAVRPLYVVSKIFGLAPYILTQKKDFEESRSFIVCISVLSLIISYDTYVIHSDINLLNYYRVFLESLPVYINSIMILQFVDFVLLLRNKYKFLNSELESLSLKQI